MSVSRPRSPKARADLRSARSAASPIRSLLCAVIVLPGLERGQQRHREPGARQDRLGLRLLGQHRRLRHQPDADRLLDHVDLWPRLLGRPAQHAAGRRRSASSSRPSSASSIGIARLSKNWLVARARRRLRRDHPQHPAAAATAVLVQRRAQGAAGCARQRRDSGRRASSTTAACSCRSRCSQPGFG